MNTHTGKTTENKTQSAANSLSRLQSNDISGFRLIDNRPEAITQRKLQDSINNSPQVNQLKAYLSKSGEGDLLSKLFNFYHKK